MDVRTLIDRPESTVALVVNTSARQGALALDRAERMVLEHPPASLRSDAVHSGAELVATLDRVMADAPDVLVVGGGDGTVSCAAARVAGTSTVLVVLPLGTANDFARTLEIPVDVEAAVRAVLTGEVVDVDLGRVNGHAFVNVASLGLSVAVTERLTDGLKRRLGPIAYPVATLAAFRGHRGFSARLELDGHESLELDDLLQVAVGNGRHYGGGNTVAPNASLDDHLLDVYAIERGRLADHVSIARLLRSGRFVEHERVHHLTTRRVRVVTGDPMPINLDGELLATTPAEFTVERNAVRVAVPRGSRAARLDDAA